MFVVALVSAGLASDAAVRTRVVHIDAVAVDARGQSVPDLKAEEFELNEGATTLSIESVRFVKIPRPAPREVAGGAIQSTEGRQVSAPAGGRLFAIFLDEFHVDPAATAAVREAMTNFVEEEIGPGDRAIVVRPLDSLLTLPLTEDQQSMTATIAAFEGRQGQHAPRTALERSLIAGAPDTLARQRAQIATSALNALALHLGQWSAQRKTLVFVSEGFARPAVRRGADVLPTLDTVIRSANRAGVSIYPIDPAALVPSADGTRAVVDDDAPSRQAARESLRALAANTDGYVLLDAAHRAEALRRIAMDSSEHYVITFRASSAADGRFHPVQLRVSRQGVNVRARLGYWAPLIDEAAAARLTASDRVVPLAPRRASPLIRPWFGWARADDGRARVSFVWEPANRPAVAGSRRAANVSLKAFGTDGGTIFEGRVRPTGAGEPSTGDVPVRAVFEAPLGPMRVEISIEDADARILDTDVRDVTVGVATGPVAFGTVEVLRLRNARDFRAAAADVAAPPVVGREFTRADRLLLRVPAYGSALSVSAQLVSRLGRIMRELTVSPGPAADLYQVDLPLAGLAVGEYRVELTAATDAARAAERLTFRVVP
jgi:VWFA-related protein